MIEELNEGYPDLCWAKSGSEFIGYEYPDEKEVVAIYQSKDMIEIKLKDEIVYIPSMNREKAHRVLAKYLAERG